ncbi:bifunctional isocitrate dehydrogenase kinase/phosphatase [Longimicrobium sp.]|uniref:bifunctional isocitrate dehydrogenase kinase/phosphatase n=1 Tax=Longimicrobium sp. TaxID=2029185 RepID=UPI003B3AFFF9
MTVVIHPAFVLLMQTAAAEAPDAIDPPSSSVDAAAEILDAYQAYLDGFLEVTRRAEGRFLRRDWRDGQRDAAERLTLYAAAVDRAVAGLRGRLRRPEGEDDAEFKTRFQRLVLGRGDAEVAGTFFNSVVRRVLGTRGVDARTEFTAEAIDPRKEGRDGPLHRAIEADGVTAALFIELFRGTGMLDAFADVEADAALCAEAAREQLAAEADGVQAAEALPFLFYRNKAAYLVARVRLASEDVKPLVVPLENRREGVRPDAVLTDPDEVHRVFSFARSYFHADTRRPRDTVAFLRTLMPAKPVHELYTSIGHNRHGKTELYRELAEHLTDPDARFMRAEGVRGLVMIVFTLRGYNVVFKVIRDVFGAPKDVDREQVMDRYRLVFARDRVGRLADAQEFEHLRFPRDRFDPDILDELLTRARASVIEDGDRIVIKHLYTERRLRPLDIYLRESEPEAAEAAVIEYGNAIRDLACANIFPGDLLLKNFGVSRHGRVIFYDYDELALLIDVRFRALPAARNEDEEMSAEPFFSVDEKDVFPEQWLPFLVPAGPLREIFLREHGDLLTVDFWSGMQRRQETGEIPDFYPYPQTRRLRLSDPEPASGRSMSF